MLSPIWCSISPPGSQTPSRLLVLFSVVLLHQRCVREKLLVRKCVRLLRAHVCEAPLERVLSFVWTGWDGAGWHSAELHGKKRVACCVCGPRQAWGKPVPTGDIIGRKNNKIRNRPSRSSPALPSAPSSASCPWTLLLHHVSFSFSPPPHLSSPLLLRSLFSYSAPPPLFHLKDQLSN